MIPAAGLGTRLWPLTNHMPKALVEVEGKPLLQHALEHLKQYGIREIIINIHHFPDQIREFVRKHEGFGLEISFSVESDELLDTGGGLKRAAWFFQGHANMPAAEPFFVRNVDIISDLNLEEMLRHHRESKALATLAVRERKTSRYLLFDDQLQLSGWENRKTGERIISRKRTDYNPLAFSGIQVLDPKIFPLIMENGSFPLIPMYLRISEKHRIAGFQDDRSRWFDAGKNMHLT